MFYRKRRGLAKTGPKKTIVKRQPFRKSQMIQIAKQEIAKNVENKITGIAKKTGAVCSATSVGLKWFIQKGYQDSSFGGAGLFQIVRGTHVNQRIGNRIKLKRWVIKGHIQPATAGYQFTESNFLVNSMQGYVDIYFGKRKDGSEVDELLYNLLQNGNTSETPVGANDQMFTTLNKDVYKVYYHRRFKMAPNYMSNSATTITPNNDFDLCKSFGFDVCRYVCKNHILTYNDATDVPASSSINDLAIWAIWTPAIGNMASSVGFNTFYQINLQSYAEYEDA